MVSGEFTENNLTEVVSVCNFYQSFFISLCRKMEILLNFHCIISSLVFSFLFLVFGRSFDRATL